MVTRFGWPTPIGPAKTPTRGGLLLLMSCSLQSAKGYVQNRPLAPVEYAKAATKNVANIWQLANVPLADSSHVIKREHVLLRHFGATAKYSTFIGARTVLEFNIAGANRTHGGVTHKADVAMVVIFCHVKLNRVFFE